MAANKFATMVHRNTHKITLILMYAVLEWTLIFLLLLNSLLSYLIVKFADYFGLKPPCLWCSRLDHVFDPSKRKDCYRDLICESHAAEISELGYCTKHKKLAESHDMCEDCSSSRPNNRGNSMDIGGKISFFSWVKEMGIVTDDGEKKIEDAEKNFKCSCCDVSLDKEFYPSPYVLFKPSWGVLDYTQKGKLITDTVGDGGESSDPCKTDCFTDHSEEECEHRDEHEENGVPDYHQMLSDIRVDVGRQEEKEKETEFDEFDVFGGNPKTEQEQEAEFDEDDLVDGNTKTEQEPSFEENDSGSLDKGNYVLIQSPNEACRSYASIEMIPLRLEYCFDSLEMIPLRPEYCSDSSEMIPLRSEYCSDLDDNRMVPIDLIDSMTLKTQMFTVSEHEEYTKLDENSDNEASVEKQDAEVLDRKTTSEEETIVCLANENVNAVVLNRETTSEEEIIVCLTNEKVDTTSPAMVESVDMDENAIPFGSPVEVHKEVLVAGVCDEVVIAQATQTLSGNGDDVEREVVIAQATQTLSGNGDDVERAETVAKSSGGFAASQEVSLRMLDKESTNDIENHEPMSLQCHIPNETSSNNAEDACINSNAYMDDNDQGPVQNEMVERLSIRSENEAEEERSPETPTYVEGLYQLFHKKSLSFDRKESGTEESLDGSVISEFENGEGSLTVERLKSALKAEHKALTVLYAELEEERSASAVAANQTMAMITRLQEEKAAMQMEALQYQRMMEEQSEYDQEALQLMNELMVKREKEKQELEKELEAYRRKVHHYEVKEKRMMRNRTSSERSGTPSVSSSNVDSDEQSVDLNHENTEEDNFFSHQESSNEKSPDAVLSLANIGLEGIKHLSTLDESLAEFEDERQSILEQLKALEEKLFTLGDEKEEEFEDVQPIVHLSEENGKVFSESYEFNSEDVNGIANGFSDELGEKDYQESRHIGVNAKRLLPLFDAIDMENGDEGLNEERGSNADFSQHSSVSKFSSNDGKVALEEEVDHVYERLQALEADREFLKHCIGSLKKGDKGMDLLQEILQHLRDLRSVELRAKNVSDQPALS